MLYGDHNGSKLSSSKTMSAASLVMAVPLMPYNSFNVSAFRQGHHLPVTVIATN
jgi:hypothetical protein